MDFIVLVGLADGAVLQVLLHQPLLAHLVKQLGLLPLPDAVAHHEDLPVLPEDELGILDQQGKQQFLLTVAEDAFSCDGGREQVHGKLFDVAGQVQNRAEFPSLVAQQLESVMRAVDVVADCVPACLAHQQLGLLLGGYLVQGPLLVEVEQPSVAAHPDLLYNLYRKLIDVVQWLQDCLLWSRSVVLHESVVGPGKELHFPGMDNGKHGLPVLEQQTIPGQLHNVDDLTSDFVDQMGNQLNGALIAVQQVLDPNKNYCVLNCIVNAIDLSQVALADGHWGTGWPLPLHLLPEEQVEHELGDLEQGMLDGPRDAPEVEMAHKLGPTLRLTLSLLLNDIDCYLFYLLLQFDLALHFSLLLLVRLNRFGSLIGIHVEHWYFGIRSGHGPAFTHGVQGGGLEAAFIAFQASPVNVHGLALYYTQIIDCQFLITNHLHGSKFKILINLVVLGLSILCFLFVNDLMVIVVMPVGLQHSQLLSFVDQLSLYYCLQLLFEYALVPVLSRLHGRHLLLAPSGTFDVFQVQSFRRDLLWKRVRFLLQAQSICAFSLRAIHYFLQVIGGLSALVLLAEVLDGRKGEPVDHLLLLFLLGKLGHFLQLPFDLSIADLLLLFDGILHVIVQQKEDGLGDLNVLQLAGVDRCRIVSPIVHENLNVGNLKRVQLGEDQSAIGYLLCYHQCALDHQDPFLLTTALFNYGLTDEGSVYFGIGQVLLQVLPGLELEVGERLKDLVQVLSGYRLPFGHTIKLCIINQMQKSKSPSKRTSPAKQEIQMKEISSRKMRDINETEMTKNDEDAEVQPVLPHRKSSDGSEELKCPKCNYQGKMNEELRMGCVSWTWFACLLTFTGVLFPIAFFCNPCKNKLKCCPMCGETVDQQFARCL